jgi:hypothetical protein
MFLKQIVVLLTGILLLQSCEKEPGVGGNSAIQGKVITHDYNASFTQLIGIYPAADQFVYIVFGNHAGYDKRIKTDYNGNFRFEFLYPGKYSIYTYSADTSGEVLSGKVAVIQNIELPKNKTFTMPDLIVYD